MIHHPFFIVHHPWLLKLWSSMTKMLKKYFFQKVAGVILDFMGTIWGSRKWLFSMTKKFKKVWFSKCRSDHFRWPNRRILGQGIGQNLNRTIFEKVEKTMIFSTFWKNVKKSQFVDGFLYSKLPMNRPWRPITGIIQICHTCKMHAKGLKWL